MAVRNQVRILALLSVLVLIAVLPASVGAAKPVPPPTNVRLTSITIDPEHASGATTNAPGAWSTNLGDVLCPLGVVIDGVFVNAPGYDPIYGPVTLGEISIPLQEGRNVLTLYGGGGPTSSGNFDYNLFYGAVLFFDGRQTPPQVAVYNANGGTDRFLVQPAGTEIMGGANGGLFFDVAPGTSVYVAPDGTTVEVQRFIINALDSTVDKVSCCGEIGADEKPDMVATLVLKVTLPKK